MLINSILTVGQLAAASTAILTFLLLVMKYMIVKPLDRRIIEKTQQIQPDANGGKSLADVALGIARVERKIENVIKRVDKLEKNAAE
jgi:F0F1-type ATP synthase membrane subunit b/b'